MRRIATPSRPLLLLTLPLLATLWLAAAAKRPVGGTQDDGGAIRPGAGERPRTSATDDGSAEGGGTLLLDFLEHGDLEALLPVATARERRRVGQRLRAFYRQRDGRPVWVRDDRPLSLEALIEILDRAAEHGLEPGDYDAKGLAARRTRFAAEPALPRDLIELELRASAAFVVYASHLATGRVGPRALEREHEDPAWYLAPEPAEPMALLEEAVDGAGVGAVLDGLAPADPRYRRLGEALARYRAIAADGGWPRVPDGETIEPGVAIEAGRYEPLVRRLAADGDLAPARAEKLLRPSADRARYGKALAAAVRRFQDRHGLAVDGKVGANTLAALNVPVQERVRQLVLDLERWRWLDGPLPADRIEVNVPAFRLEGYRQGRRQLAMKVVVGKDSWKTPVFRDEMVYVEINPYWNVPASIAEEEILPQVRRDPSYLAAEDMEVLRGWNGGAAIDPATIDWSSVDPDEIRFRQRPGKGNALGLIKFIFPNRFDVYLHDTPAQAAFDRPRRARSHGCVRVERPLDLAHFVFADRRDWNRRRVAKAIESGRNQRVNLRQPLPVMILYRTAFVAADGTAHFRDDVYGYDQALLEALAARTEAARRAAT